LIEVQEREDGGGYISKAAPLGQDWCIAVFGDVEKGYWVGGVGGVGATSERVYEHLGVAVVGGDQQAAAALADGLVDTAQLGVDGFDGADGGFHLAGVADHVGVGEVDDDDVEGGVVDGFDDGVGYAGGGHLGGEVVGGDLLGRDEGAVFAGEGFLDASVEEVSYVRILLGLGHAEVAEVGLRHEVGEEVIHRFCGDDDGKFEVFVVLGHADVVEVGGDFREGYLGVEFGGVG